MSDSLKNGIATIADMLAKAGMSIAGAGVILMMLHITLDVVLKKFFVSPIPMTLETVAHYYMVLAVFLPMAYVESVDKHFRVDVAEQFMSERLKRGLDVLGSIFGICFFSFLAWHSWFFAMDKFSEGEMVMSSEVLVIWPTRFLVPIGAGLYAFVLFARLIAPQGSTPRGTEQVHD